MTRPEDAVGMRGSLTSRNVESKFITCAIDINATWASFSAERTGPLWASSGKLGTSTLDLWF
jgi:hypothetical protein